MSVNNVKGEVDVQRLPTDAEEYSYSGWLFKYTKSHILHSLCTTRDQCENLPEKQCLLCL